MPVLKIENQLLNCNDKLYLIEMQGKLEVSNGDFANLTVGTLRVENGIPEMIIGKQRLQGTVTKLKKPIIIMDTQSENDKAAKLIQVLEEKIVFNSRPLTV